MYSSWRVTSIDIWTYFSTYSTNVESWSIQSLVHILELGFEVLHLSFIFLIIVRWQQTMTSRMWLDEQILMIKTNKKENWTHQLLPHENPTVAKKACLSCEQGWVEVDVFYLEISLEKFWRVWVEMSVFHCL